MCKGNALWVHLGQRCSKTYLRAPEVPKICQGHLLTSSTQQYKKKTHNFESQALNKNVLEAKIVKIEIIEKKRSK